MKRPISLPPPFRINWRRALVAVVLGGLLILCKARRQGLISRLEVRILLLPKCVIPGKLCKGHLGTVDIESARAQRLFL